MATSNVSPANGEKEVKKPEVVEVKARKRVFNLTSFEAVTKEKIVKFLPAATVKEALERLEGDQDKLLAMVNDGLEHKAKIDGRAEIELAENEVPVGVIQTFTKNFLPMFSKEKDKKAQRAKAIAYVAGIPPLMAALKTFAEHMKNVPEPEEEDED